MQDRFDILIIGSGLAGLGSALKLAQKFRVALVTKSSTAEANTNYAQGGIAAVFSGDDSMEAHLQDTLHAGAGLCNEVVARKIIGDGPKLVRDLIQWGVEFSKQAGGAFDLAREGGHSHRRILHAGDITGREIETALVKKVRQSPNIRIFENHAAIDLVLANKVGPIHKKNRCLGAYVLNKKNNQVVTIGAGVTILATGGAGKVYLYTSNPDVATGDGMAMAYRAGVAIMNLEFVQFHPTCLFNPGGWSPNKKNISPHEKSFLISEAIRGEGATLKLSHGESFMENYSPERELAPRDVVARAIDFEMKKRGDEYVLLDISNRDGDFIKNRFPNIYATCLKFGYDLTKGPLPVVPAAHYFCGGVLTDVAGATSLEGLFAIGETAATGFHGANRLASNSLLEAVAMADYASQKIMSEFLAMPKLDVAIPPWNPGRATDTDEAVVITHNWDEIRRTLWNYVGIVRSNKRLERAKRRIELLQEEIREYYWNVLVTGDLIELRNIACVAGLIIDSALMRKESRGLHYNRDYPLPVAAEKKNTIISLPQ